MPSTCIYWLAYFKLKVKVKQFLFRPSGFQEVEAAKFYDNQNMKAVCLSDLLTGRLYPTPLGNIPGTHFCWSQPQDHSAEGMVIWMKKFKDTVGSRNHDLPACSAVPNRPVPPRAPDILSYFEKNHTLWNSTLRSFSAPFLIPCSLIPSVTPVYIFRPFTPASWPYDGNIIIQWFSSDINGIFRHIFVR